MQLTIAQNLESLQESLLAEAREGKRIALVPTMGALHEGHAALIKHAAGLADVVVVSVFVNPRQFGPNEDLARYPRTPEEDAKVAQAAGASIMYMPDVEDLYPDGYATSINPGPIAQGLCGDSRPGHFDGVATVVTKLLLRVLPHVAVFGEKDYQQLCVIRRVVEDLDIPVEIIGVPTVREPDGLALSSRNRYLSQQERATAPKLYETLSEAATQIATASRPAQEVVDAAAYTLTAYGYKVEYLELRSADTLVPQQTLQKPARLLAAAWLGKTRLIDNIPLE